MAAVRLFKGLTDRSGHDRVLALRDMGERVAHPMDAAALPRCLEDPGDGGLEAGVGIADDQLHPIEPASLQAAQEVHPEGFCLRRPDAQPDDFPAPLGVGGNGDYGGHADDPSPRDYPEFCALTW